MHSYQTMTSSPVRSWFWREELKNKGVGSRIRKTLLFLCVWKTWKFFWMCSITIVHRCFYPHSFALYVIKINESWRLKLISTCQLFYDHIVDIKKSPNCALAFVSEVHDYDTRRTYLQHLSPCIFIIDEGDSVQKLWDATIKMIFLYQCGRSLLGNFKKCCYCESFFSVFINVFLRPRTIDTYKVWFLFALLYMWIAFVLLHEKNVI